MAETHEETSGTDSPASNAQLEPHSRNVNDSEHGEDGADDGVAGNLNLVASLAYCCVLNNFVLNERKYKTLYLKITLKYKL